MLTFKNFAHSISYWCLNYLVDILYLAPVASRSKTYLTNHSARTMARALQQLTHASAPSVFILALRAKHGANE